MYHVPYLAAQQQLLEVVCLGVIIILLLSAQHRDNTLLLTDPQDRLGGRDSTMRSTKTLMNVLGSFLSKINHAAPINQRESRRLLDALTASFRKHLDEEHGQWPEDAPPLRSKSPPPPRRSKLPVTDRHVRAILSNPLFSYDPTKTTSKFANNADPMATFDHAIAKGLMTPDRAAGILSAQLTLASNPFDTSRPSSDIGLRVIQWIRSSGLERDLSFIACHRLIKILVVYMVEEGLDEIAWIWLDRLMREEGPVLSLREGGVTHASFLMYALIRAKASAWSNLDNAYALMIRADDMFSHIRDFQQAAISPWQYLSIQSIIRPSRPQPSVALFNSFTAISKHLPPRPSLMLHRAHLDLYHPTHPDATLAIDYFKSLMPYKTLPGTKSFQKLISMAADAAGHLAQTGRQADAEWVRGLLRIFQNTEANRSPTFTI